jgi:predicted aspartyl protease
MPHFTLNIGPLGPVLTAVIGVSAARAAALAAASQPLPNPVVIKALVDTGASCTCVDPGKVAPLGLTATGSTPMHTPSTGTVPHLAANYDVSFYVITAANLPVFRLDTVSVVESSLSHMGIDALLGRDILEHCTLHYNGATGLFTLAY